MNKEKLTTRDLCMIGIWAAIIAVMAQIAIPMPMGVPMTMQTFAVTLSALVLGSKKGAMASLIYVLIGAIGIPVYANFTGGIHILFGPTGGFLISFPIMAYVIGLGAEYVADNKVIYWLMITIGTIVNYIIGVIIFCIVAGAGIEVALGACVVPFIPTAIIKALASGILGIKIRPRLVKII